MATGRGHVSCTTATTTGPHAASGCNIGCNITCNIRSSDLLQRLLPSELAFFRRHTYGWTTSTYSGPIRCAYPAGVGEAVPRPRAQ